ncbi:hypothetical protein GCM10010170_073770 [Dactylosporangium salmoneum]|uniref:Uncharacterized protein n=1 Tax=Dactylosporangium salmoneum TaxID=53361 RepID=A0ABN3H803_9ACTN
MAPASRTPAEALRSRAPAAHVQHGPDTDATLPNAGAPPLRATRRCSVRIYAQTCNSESWPAGQPVFAVNVARQ